MTTFAGHTALGALVSLAACWSLSAAEAYLPTAEAQAVTWRYTLKEPGANWTQRPFDDRDWRLAPGGFGTAHTPGAVVRTEWTNTQIWLRREFTLTAPVTNTVLRVHFDEDATVYLNGVLAAKLDGWSTGYEEWDLAEAAVATLKPGTNLMAVHCRQTYGGQYIDAGLVRASGQRWSRERAWKWYLDQGWLCGFNYVPANAISYTEMWMDYAFDPQLIDRELALAEKTGFNCLRVVLSYVAWEGDPGAFRKRFEEFLGLAARHRMKVMPCFFDDCVFGPITDPVYGRQPEVVPGWYANGWTPSPGHKLVRDRSAHARLEAYVKDILKPHARDERILCWDLYNEAGNSGLDGASLPLLQSVFSWARELDPAQPITSGVFGGFAPIRQWLLTQSDVITFHNYDPVENLKADIRQLKARGRPVICTEWLNRGRKSTVFGCLPVFAQEKVGALHWGLVNGKTQTHLPWGHRPGQPDPAVWQHDLYHPDLKPYNPAELDLFQSVIRQMTTAGRPSSSSNAERSGPERAERVGSAP